MTEAPRASSEASEEERALAAWKKAHPTIERDDDRHVTLCRKSPPRRTNQDGITIVKEASHEARRQPPRGDDVAYLGQEQSSDQSAAAHEAQSSKEDESANEVAAVASAPLTIAVDEARECAAAREPPVEKDAGASMNNSVTDAEASEVTAPWKKRNWIGRKPSSDLVEENSSPSEPSAAEENQAAFEKDTDAALSKRKASEGAAAEDKARDQAAALDADAAALRRKKSSEDEVGRAPWKSSTWMSRASSSEVPPEKAEQPLKAPLRKEDKGDATWVKRKPVVEDVAEVAAALLQPSAADEAREQGAARRPPLFVEKEKDAAWMMREKEEPRVSVTPTIDASEPPHRRREEEEEEVQRADLATPPSQAVPLVSFTTPSPPYRHHTMGGGAFSFETPNTGRMSSSPESSGQKRRKSVSMRRKSMSRAMRKSVSPGQGPSDSEDDEDLKEIPVAPAVDALLGAAEMGDVEACRILIADHGVAADAEDPNDGYTPLLVAAEEGHVEVAKCLLSYGAKTNKVDGLGRTPLYAAAVAGQAEVVTYLIREAKADPTITDLDGRSPLWAACATRQTEAAKALLVASQKRNLDIDVNRPDPCGLTAFQFANKQGYQDIKKLLRKNGAYDGGTTTSRLDITPP